MLDFHRLNKVLIIKSCFIYFDSNSIVCRTVPNAVFTTNDLVQDMSRGCYNYCAPKLIDLNQLNIFPVHTFYNFIIAEQLKNLILYHLKLIHDS